MVLVQPCSESGSRLAGTSSSAISTTFTACLTASPAGNVADRRTGTPLMRIDQLPRSDRVEDQRADGPRGFPMGRTGGIGLGTIVLLVLVGWALGINPMYLIGGADLLSRLGGDSSQQSQSAP